MTRSPISFLVLVGCVLSLPVGSARAQAPLPIQDRPTLSPWLNLYRRDPGPVGPYLSYVRPEQRLLGRLAQQSSAISRQNAAITALRNQAASVGTETTIAPTGTGATFMNYSHYFGSVGGSAGRGNSRSWTPPPANSGGYSGY